MNKTSMIPEVELFKNSDPAAFYMDYFKVAAVYCTNYTAYMLISEGYYSIIVINVFDSSGT
jgi:hypothetical protein